MLFSGVNYQLHLDRHWLTSAYTYKGEEESLLPGIKRQTHNNRVNIKKEIINRNNIWTTVAREMAPIVRSQYLYQSVPDFISWFHLSATGAPPCFFIVWIVPFQNLLLKFGHKKPHQRFCSLDKYQRYSLFSFLFCSTCLLYSSSSFLNF